MSSRLRVAMAEEKQGKEGSDLLGSPSFTLLENGRFKCSETGHEMLSKDKEFYSRSKRCRLGLIDFALSKNKPPLNMFKQDLSSRSKLICNLTGDTVNKSEEHIWKHINGKRFLNKLEQKEMGNIEEKAEEEKEKLSVNRQGNKEKKKKKQKDEKAVEEIISEMRNCDSEEEEFWMPPVGERWDFDDGGDRWGSDEESLEEPQEENGAGAGAEENGESDELSKRTKRMSIEIGPSSFASRKKKKKKNPTS